MKQEIKNPYKINIGLYVTILIISIICLSICVYYEQEDNCKKIIEDIVKNISLGCIASTIVALLIEIYNIKEKNQKINNIYYTTYLDLRFSIMKYIESWSVFCLIVNKESNYKSKKYSWLKWYELTKMTIKNIDEKHKEEAIYFLKSNLTNNIELVNKSLFNIIDQKKLLEINDIYNDKMDIIIKDFEFEFNCAKKELDFKQDIDKLFKSFDALNNDIFKQISNWSDISFYNELKFSPYKFFEALTYYTEHKTRFR